MCLNKIRIHCIELASKVHFGEQGILLLHVSVLRLWFYFVSTLYLDDKIAILTHFTGVSKGGDRGSGPSPVKITSGYRFP